MTVSFVDNYKTIRNKFYAQPKPVIMPKKAEVKEQPTVVPDPVPPESLGEIERWARYGGTTNHRYRDMLADAHVLRTEAEKRGISYYTRLMEGMPTVSNRVKLAVIIVLEEYSIDWRSLFDKDRSRFKTAIRWKVFDAIREEGVSLGEIARICDVDHTSVMHGLRRIHGEKTND